MMRLGACFFSFLLMFLSMTTHSFAVTPIEHYNSLVAGGDEAGYRDGAFALARFNNPSGLCFDHSGSKLYVADSENNRVRIVDLAHDNDVATLAGSGVPGKDDGLFEKATFNRPVRIAFLSNDRLAVYDAGSGLLRILDLKARSVTTVSGGVSIWDMVYRPQDDSLYFSQIDNKSLGKLDLKSLVYSTIFSNNPQLPAPQALCLDGDKLYVADQNLTTVYEVSVGDGKSTDQKEVVLKAAGQGDHILEMTVSDGVLYALQPGKNSLVRVGSPKSVPVTLATSWGFLMDGTNPGVEPLMDIQADQPLGFVSSPIEKRKFLVSRPGEDRHSIISLKDYHFDQFWKATDRAEPDPNHAMDYDYPYEKPLGTYRIFLVGDSRTFIAPEVVPGSKYDNDWFYSAPRNNTMGKQLELFLNTEAALCGVKTHYEVLEWNRRGMDLSSYAYYELPPIIEKYHMDMVLALDGNPGYGDYYTKPLTAEGIPIQDNDFEYMLKPLSERIPPGPAADLIRLVQKKETLDMTAKSVYPGNYSTMDFLCNADPEIRKDLIEMTGRPLYLLSQKLNAMKTSDGYSPKLVLFNVPYGWPNNDKVDAYWADLCQRFQFPYINLSEGYDALKIGYYPAATNCCSGHYTAYGSKLVGYLLCRHLIDEKLVPFETEEKK